MNNSVVYPYVDEYDYTWLDPSGFKHFVELNGEKKYVKSPCFICNRFTYRVDLDYHGIFCNSYVCNLVIQKDLEQYV
jgi:hypothetical protein